MKHKSSVYVFSGISLSTKSAVIGLTSLLFNKSVNGFNSIIEKKNCLSSTVILIKLYYIA